MKNKTILVAEDSITMRMLVSQTLSDAGYHVIEASNGEEAIAELNGRTIDLVLTDLNMPILGGMGVVSEVRRNDQYKLVPVLLLTTESKPSIKQEARERGATGWIVKPFVEDQLLYMVERVMK